MKNPKLWISAVLQNYLKPTIAIEIGKRKRTAVVNEVKTKRARDFAEHTVAMIEEEYIAFAAVPGIAGANEFVDGVPS